MEKNTITPHLEKEDKWAIFCQLCGFEAKRGMPEDLAERVAVGHCNITGHIVTVYEVNPLSPLGWTHQRLIPQEKVDKLVDLSA